MRPIQAHLQLNFSRLRLKSPDRSQISDQFVASRSATLAISNYLTSKLINEYHIEESCVLFVTENLNIYQPNPVKFTLNVRSTIGNFNLRKRLGHKTSLPPSRHSCLTRLGLSTKTNMAAGFRRTWQLSTGNAAS